LNSQTLAIQLAKNIRQQEPTLDLEGADRKVLQVALQDLTSYLSYLQTQHQPIDAEEAPQEVNAFLSVWTGMWLKKWRQRFGLLIGENNPRAEAPQTAGRSCIQWENLGCREELTRLVVDALIRRSEICGTKIIAEDILRREIQVASGDVNSREVVFKILGRALEKVEAVSQSSKPLVMIKIQKNYYCHC
jgi:hypothetical protein